MKRYIAAAFAFILIMLLGLLFMERSHYAEPGQMAVHMRFVAFTNTFWTTGRVGIFAISNISSWPVVVVEYPQLETKRTSGPNITIVHTFHEGPFVLPPHQTTNVYVYMREIPEEESLRLIARFYREEGIFFSTLMRIRVLLDGIGLPVKVNLRQKCEAQTDWIQRNFGLERSQGSPHSDR